MTVTIGRLEDLARFLDATGANRVVFRGQGDVAWGLVPSMFRGNERVKEEGYATDLFRREALAFVRLERACLAAKGRALGTGYVDVPGS